MTNLKMNLLENSTSFFVEAATKAIKAESEKEEWKFALLLLVQAIETCLKERLRRENSIFLYTNIDRPKHTVDIHLALARLQNISRIELAQKDIESINSAVYLRNQIIHFEFDLSLEQIKSNFTRLVGFYTSFCQQHLDTEIEQYVPDQLHQGLLTLKHYVSELLRRAEERIARENISQEFVWECNACGQFTFVVQDAKDTCFLCNHKQPVSECAWCSNLEYADELCEIYTGNYKRLHAYDYVCRSCYEKRTNEDPYEYFY